jgi:hypothetical protein
MMQCCTFMMMGPVNETLGILDDDLAPFDDVTPFEGLRHPWG